MVVREDGTKWACQSCLKGHRVSGCNHTDRELVQVPKKGRPVTQCQHCRQERKKRSAHVSCDCGDAGKHHHPREKCIHLREAEERAKAGLREQPVAEKDSDHLAAIKEEQGCCCHHGGKCTCSVMKRENQDPSAPHGPAVKPRLEKTGSDGAITNFVNGHHKPVHRKNHAAHENGMPYRKPIPRSNSHQSSDYSTSQSTESLPLESSSVPIQQGNWLPLTSRPYPTDRRKSQSELTSPRLLPMQTSLGGLPDFSTGPMDFATLTPMRTNDTAYSASSGTMEFPGFDDLSSFSEDELDPWTDMSTLDTTTIKPTNQQSVQAWAMGTPDNNVYQPGLTGPPSIAASEGDEVASIESVYGISIPEYQGGSPGFGFDGSNNHSPNPNRHSLPPGFFGNAEFSHGGMSNEWQTAVANSAASHQNKLSTSPVNMEGAWQDLGRQENMNTSPTSFGGLPNVQRPQSRSVGPNSAPSDDALRELFPDMDLDNIPELSQSQPKLVSRNTFHGMPSSMPTSVPTNYISQPLHSSPEHMATESWNDTSYGFPQEPYQRPLSYTSDNGYASQPYTPSEWSR